MDSNQATVYPSFLKTGETVYFYDCSTGEPLLTGTDSSCASKSITTSSSNPSQSCISQDAPADQPLHCSIGTQTDYNNIIQGSNIGMTTSYHGNKIKGQSTMKRCISVATETDLSTIGDRKTLESLLRWALSICSGDSSCCKLNQSPMELQYGQKSKGNSLQFPEESPLNSVRQCEDDMPKCGTSESDSSVPGIRRSYQQREPTSKRQCRYNQAECGETSTEDSNISGSRKIYQQGEPTSKKQCRENMAECSASISSDSDHSGGRRSNIGEFRENMIDCVDNTSTSDSNVSGVRVSKNRKSLDSCVHVEKETIGSDSGQGIKTPTSPDIVYSGRNAFYSEGTENRKSLVKSVQLLKETVGHVSAQRKEAQGIQAMGPCPQMTATSLHPSAPSSSLYATSQATATAIVEATGCTDKKLLGNDESCRMDYNDKLQNVSKSQHAATKSVDKTWSTQGDVLSREDQRNQIAGKDGLDIQIVNTFTLTNSTKDALSTARSIESVQSLPSLLFTQSKYPAKTVSLAQSIQSDKSANVPSLQFVSGSTQASKLVSTAQSGKGGSVPSLHLVSGTTQPSELVSTARRIQSPNSATITQLHTVSESLQATNLMSTARNIQSDKSATSVPSLHPVSESAQSSKLMSTARIIQSDKGSAMQSLHLVPDTTHATKLSTARSSQSDKSATVALQLVSGSAQHAKLVPTAQSIHPDNSTSLHPKYESKQPTEVVSILPKPQDHVNEDIVVVSPNRPGCECQQCGKVFSRPGNLENHAKHDICIKRPHKCKICGKRFARPLGLRIHNSAIHNKNKPYECSLCDKRFSQKSCLNEHLPVHSGEKPFQCPVCHQRFTYRDGLRKHMLRNIHKST